ncbi:GNAT family N-acetyltransferase [Vallitalea maricola]|uniref:GNAT family N-acetyltransferase n=1 Tax=Vallitalea maricola TaxID=3074433 RepID=A0ACB5UPA8_9FIRM|nr:GNAT family N-acetyltransferase [Vallitalea sp. AN17-2]
MKEVKLVEPSILYRESFLDFIEDVKETGYESYELYSKAEKDFNEFIKELLNSSKGINIPEGWVPCSSFWLVDNLEEVIGVIRIRHCVNSEFLEMVGHIGYEIKSTHRKKGYGSKLLELGLVEARKLGLEEVIITCDENNIGSRKIIEKFKGKYIKSIFDMDNQRNLLQYKV